ncbi:hypothetical protein [Bradyrhizobium sp. ARR65]|uniref:hypothetical protein n=1 Tax=Bradyrhizobium sp. ARR65 TaxID=1040989 RepID=UPI0004655CE4|nr:hypothetical protein [Bradyrhizobium sp. ARR65]
MNVSKILGLAGLGALLVLSAPVERAQALSLSNPAAVSAVQDGTRLTTEVHWRYHRHWHRPHWHRGWHRGWHRRHWHHHWR